MFERNNVKQDKGIRTRKEDQPGAKLWPSSGSVERQNPIYGIRGPSNDPTYCTLNEFSRRRDSRIMPARIEQKLLATVRPVYSIFVFVGDGMRIHHRVMPEKRRAAGGSTLRHVVNTSM